MTVMRSLKKLRRNYQDYGLRVTLGKTWASAIAIALESRTYRIYRIRLDQFVPGEMDTGGLELRLLRWDEDGLITQIEGMEEWLQDKLHNKLRAGSMCLVALDEGRVAGFNLVSFGKVDMPLVNMTRVFRGNEAWSEQITVSRDNRGRGLASILRRTVFGLLKERGIIRFYGGTLPLNIANRKLSEKVGFKEIGDIYYRRVLDEKTWTFKRIEKDDEKD